MQRSMQNHPIKQLYMGRKKRCSLNDKKACYSASYRELRKRTRVVVKKGTLWHDFKWNQREIRHNVLYFTWWRRVHCDQKSYNERVIMYPCQYQWKSSRFQSHSRRLTCLQPAISLCPRLKLRTLWPHPRFLIARVILHIHLHNLCNLNIQLGEQIVICNLHHQFTHHFIVQFQQFTYLSRICNYPCNCG